MLPLLAAEVVQRPSDLVFHPEACGRVQVRDGDFHKPFPQAELVHREGFGGAIRHATEHFGGDSAAYGQAERFYASAFRQLLLQRTV